METAKATELVSVLCYQQRLFGSIADLLKRFVCANQIKSLFASLHGESAKQVQVLLRNSKYISGPNYLLLNIMVIYPSKIFWLIMPMDHYIVLNIYVN